MDVLKLLYFVLPSPEVTPHKMGRCHEERVTEGTVAVAKVPNVCEADEALLGLRFS